MRNPHRVNSRGCLLATLAGACAIPANFVQGETAQPIIRLTAWDAQPGDGFGSSVAVDTQVMIVGAPTSGPTTGPGSAYLYDLNSGGMLFTLTPSDSTVDDRFGSSVAVNNTAIIGATFGGSDVSSIAGAAYLFDVNTGYELFKLNPSDTEALDRFGSSVAITGNTAVIGAWSDNTAAGVDAGSAYIFDTTTGNELAKLTASDASPGAWFGSAVAVAGNTAVIGAYHDSATGIESGAAYIFDTVTGTQTFKLTPHDATPGAHFGWSVATGNGLAVIGSPTSDSSPGPGAAYIFDQNTGQQLLKLTASDTTVGDRFGTSVAIGQNIAIIGATLAATDASNLAGAAYIFDLTTGQQLAKLTASDSQAIDYFGGSVTINDNTAVIGAHGNNTADGVDAGAAYLFDLTPPLPADLDGDGFVGLADLNLILANWNKSTPSANPLADPSGDGFVGISDLTLILTNWNAGTPPIATSIIPEPSTTTVFLVTSLATLRRNTRPISA